MKIAFCFAGQGSQAVGMGNDFYNEFPYAKELYDKFPEIRDLCFYDKEARLNETAYAQKAMLLTSYIYAKALKDNDIEPEYVCGLSLGEYSALAFANAWSIEDSIDIITRRGEIMQNALPLGTTKMAAILGLDKQEIITQIGKVSGVCEIANYNCPGQIVITGEVKAVNDACKLLTEAGARRCIPLNVSGAFHSSLLNDASKELRNKLDEYTPNELKYKVIYNISGKEENGNLNDILQKQICSSVHFDSSIEYLINQGVDTFVEIGPGKALSGFIKKINKDVKVLNVTDINSLNEAIKELK